MAAPFGSGPPWAPGGAKPPGVPPDAPKIAAPQAPQPLPYVGNTSWGLGFASATTLGPFGVNANIGDGVIIAISHATTRTVTIKDNYGSLYLPAVAELYTNSNYLDLFYCPYLLGTNPSVTITGSGTLGVAYVAWLQIVGANPGWFVDGVSTVAHNTNANLQPFVRTTSPNDLIVTVIGGGSSTAPSFGAGYRYFNFGGAATTIAQAFIAYSLSPQPNWTIVPAWTNGGGNQDAALTLAIRAAGQAPSHIGPPGGLPVLAPWMRGRPPYPTTEIPVSSGVATINAGVGAYSWAGTGSNVPTQINSDGGATAYSWAGTTATVNELINAGIGAWSWAGVTSTTSELINAGIGAWSWAGTASAVPTQVNSVAGAWTWAGTTATTNEVISEGVGAYTWAGTTATTFSLINAGVGSYSWAGTTAALTQLISAATGAYTWAASTATLGGGISASVGAYTWAGTTSTASGLINAGVGAWTWAGLTATTSALIQGAVGAYTWAGTTAALTGPINASVGAYTWSGTTAGLLATPSARQRRQWIETWQRTFN